MVKKSGIEGYKEQLKAWDGKQDTQLGDKDLFDRGVARVGIGDLLGAKKDFMALAKRNATHPYVSYALAQVYEKLGDRERATYFYKRALNFRETQQEARQALAELNAIAEVDDASARIVELKPVQSDITFKDVIGLDDVKLYLFSHVVLALKKPELFQKYGKKQGVGILLFGPPGCLVGDTRVILGDGRIAKIKDLGERHLQTIHQNIQTGNRRWFDIATTFHKYENQPIMEVITETGKSIKGTFNHPLLIQTKKYMGKRQLIDPILHKTHFVDWYTSDVMWKRLDELKIGDRLRVAPSFYCRKKGLVDTNFKRFSNHTFKGKLPTKVTPKLGSLLGYLLGDGWIAKDQYSIGMIVSEDELDLLPKLKTMIQDVFGIIPRIEKRKIKDTNIFEKGKPPRLIVRKQTMTYLSIDSVDIAKNLYSLRDKRVPQSILSSKNDVVSEFLRWLFTADGMVSDKKPHRVSFKAKNIELTRDIQLLLLRFGIASRIYTWNEASCLEINGGNDILKYAKAIGFACNKKSERLESLVSKIPKKNRFHRQKRFERIVKIVNNDEKADVYDIEVPRSHQFIANGIVSHNTGKTLIARAVAGEANAYMLVARIQQILGEFVGVTEKNLHAIFEQARMNSPCLIFMDELDALGGKRSEMGGSDEHGGNASQKIAINQFLIEMNGMEKNPEGIFVITASNRPWDIDPALKRSGRLGDAIYVGPPNKRERWESFRYHLRNKRCKGIDYGRLARATVGYSQADIEKICDDATLTPLIKEFKTSSEQTLTTRDILKVIARTPDTMFAWYLQTRREILGRFDMEMMDRQVIRRWKSGSLEAQEKVQYKKLIDDIIKNTNPYRRLYQQASRLVAIYLS